MRLKARSEEDERKFITQVQEILADPGGYSCPSALTRVSSAHLKATGRS